MAQRDYLIAFGIWIVFAATRLLYGLLDKYVLTPNIGEYFGHVIGSAIMLVIIMVLSYLFVRGLEIQKCNRSDFLFIGLFWLMLSFSTAFIYNRYIGEDTWEPFLRWLDISNGGLRGPVLLAEFFAPLIFGSIRLRRHFKRRRRRSYRT